MNIAIYRRLAEFLDTLPGGFAPTSGDADINLLAGLFSEPEAELGPCLSLELEPAAAIAAHAALPEEETTQLLEGMAAKGLILSVAAEGAPTLYRAIPFAFGIYELQINNLTPELRRNLEAFWSSQKQRQMAPTIPQMRVIPIGESLETRLEVLPYEQVEALLQAQEHFAVAPCICRQRARIAGHGCDVPEESCMMFGEWAQYYARTGRGRAIERDEARAILARANAANLVLEPSNSQDIAFLCSCCGCCCGVLHGLKSMPRPADAVVNDFAGQLDADACIGCWTCLKRCQMEALAADGDRVMLKSERCIGCGLCVTTCPSGALKMARKAEHPAERIPSDLLAAWNTIRQQQAQPAQHTQHLHTLMH
ncbi:MAG: 4Fe-4S dicluster domain-containing protein [Chloroflexi bacterium]|nr:4Fe-4S dicluster domain-containing protein [Chloroflexota bacterium]